VHQVIARNYAVASENKIHSDSIAKRLGFSGALVPGATVFGHLTWPVTAQLGERWLQKSLVTTRFIKPAYDGEQLTITDRHSGGPIAVECHNSAGVLLATLECRPEALPAIDARSKLTGGSGAVERVEIGWDAIRLNQPFASYVWTPDAAQNAEFAARLNDETELFKRGVLHPHAILSQANQALVRQFIMPAWIHTGSEIRFRNLLRIGDSIEVRSVPIDKWEKKGHQFIKLYVALVKGAEVATEIYHTAIFRVAENSQ